LKQKEDHKNWDKLFKKAYKYFPKVKSYIKANSGSRQDAEDVFQKALLLLHEKHVSGDFELSSSPETFLFGAAKNYWMNELRKRKNRAKASLHDVNPIDTDKEEKELKIDFALKAIQGLGEKCRQILEMFYLHKKSMTDIMEFLNMKSQNAAKTQKYKCLTQARNAAMNAYKKSQS
jgi:RNA polymerase sigma factor (sigma-70 family)